MQFVFRYNPMCILHIQWVKDTFLNKLVKWHAGYNLDGSRHHIKPSAITPLRPRLEAQRLFGNFRNPGRQGFISVPFLVLCTALSGALTRDTGSMCQQIVNSYRR